MGTPAAVKAIGHYAEWTCDEIAECVNGITNETYAELWNLIEADPNAPVRMYWNNLTEAAQTNITESIKAAEAKIALWDNNQKAVRGFPGK